MQKEDEQRFFCHNRCSAGIGWQMPISDGGNGNTKARRWQACSVALLSRARVDVLCMLYWLQNAAETERCNLKLSTGRDFCGFLY